MPTTVTRTVDDGSNVGTPDYSSLSAFESGEQRDLTTADEIAEAECYGFVDTSATSFGGWTTSTTQYINVRVASSHRHSGIWTGDGTSYLLDPGLNGGIPFGMSSTHDVRLDGVQLFARRDDQFTSPAINANHDGTATTDCRFSDLIVRYEQTGSGNGMAFRGNSTASSNEYRWRNCLLWGSNFGANATAELISDNAGTFWGHNLTGHVVSGAGTDDAQLGSQFGTFHATNSRVSGVATFGNTASDSDFNLSEDASAPGSNSLTNQTSSYVDAANGDFHLQSGDPGVDSGTDLSGDTDYAVTTDFEGDDRTGGTYDIGADEFVSGAISVSLTETVVARDTLEDTATLTVEVADVASAQSTETETITMREAVSEVGVATDQLTDAQVMVEVLSEATRANDQMVGTLGRVFAAVLTESASATDTVQSRMTAVETITETVRAADQLNITATMRETLAESAVAADTITAPVAGVITATFKESVSAGESLETTMTMTAQVREAVRALDRLGLTQTLVTQVIEQAAASDQLESTLPAEALRFIFDAVRGNQDFDAVDGGTFDAQGSNDFDASGAD